MYNLDKVISTREIGELGISIATSVALESLFKKTDINETEIWINVRTLFRNLHGAIEGDYRKFLSAEALVPTLIGEMGVITRNIEASPVGHLEVHFYSCSYNDLTRKLPNAILREAHTPLQLIYTDLEQQTLDQVKNKRNSLEQPMHLFQTTIKGRATRARAVLLTHSPIDLLFNDFSNVRLLESHTGALKSKTEWNTKLTNAKLLPPLPFNAFTVQVFGDNNTYISGMPIKIKEAVVKMAETDRWNPISTNDRISASIAKMPDKFGAQFLKRVLRS